MDDYLKILLLVGSRLEQAGIPYMLSGSTAMNFYARPRMTRDIDIVIELGASDVGKVVDLFQEDFSIDEQEIREALARQSLFNLVHYDTVVKVDCVVRKRAAYRQEEFNRRRPIEVEGQRIWIVSPEDLVLSKLYWARESLSEWHRGFVGEGGPMNDTLPRAEALVRALLLQRSGQDRLKMAADMFAASRAIMAASLGAEGLQPGSVEWKLRLLERTYGAEISPAVRRRLLERWRASPFSHTR